MCCTGLRPALEERPTATSCAVLLSLTVGHALSYFHFHEFALLGTTVCVNDMKTLSFI